MFMSIFSSLDALCAESIGQKLGNPAAASKVGSSSVDCKAGSGASSSTSKDDHNKTPPRMNTDNRRRVQPEKRLRCALELDGLHCFETIVPY